MDKEKKKKMEQKNELTNSGQRFPVEQVSNTGKPTKKQVKAAVKELNPDVSPNVRFIWKERLGSRSPRTRIGLLSWIFLIWI